MVRLLMREYLSAVSAKQLLAQLPRFAIRMEQLCKRGEVAMRAELGYTTYVVH